VILFWDRENKPIENTIEWAKKFEDTAYRVIAVDQDGPDTPIVSTIWNGLDRGLGLRPTPETVLIFETAYLEDGLVVQFWLDNTEEQALQRHRMVCLSMLGREPRDDGHVATIIANDKRTRGS
jgi:hypothetical protein